MTIQRKLVGALVLVALLSLTGCSIPTPVSSNRVAPVDATVTMLVLSTQVEATQQALREQAGNGAMSPTQEAGEGAPSNETPEPPPQEEPSPPAPTETDPAPRANVLENTNCRSGPGTVYDLRYIALAGETLTVVARSSFSDYVVVLDPSHSGQECWLWTRYVELEGDIDALPLRSPPPTPTPSLSFTAAYDFMDGCVGWDPAFVVTNTGTITFKSYAISAYDTVTTTTVSTSVDNFDETNGCPVITAIPELAPGMSGWVHAYSFIYDPTGHALQVTITLCTEPGLGGSCVSQNLTVTP